MGTRVRSTAGEMKLVAEVRRDLDVVRCLGGGDVGFVRECHDVMNETRWLGATG